MKILKIYTIAAAAIMSAFAVNAEEASTPATAENSAVFTGAIAINMGMTIDVPDQTVVIENAKNGTCDFKLADFKLDPTADESMGDIQVDGVKVSKGDDGVITYTGSADEISLAGGFIKASATLEGTEDADHKLVMNIHVIWHMDDGSGTVTDTPIEVTFNGTLADDKRAADWTEKPKPVAPQDGAVFTGAIVIDLGEPIDVPNQTVVLENAKNGTCDFKLADFKLDPTAEESMGDIQVDGVKVEKGADGVIKYTGSADEISLAGGFIKASATLEGTEDADHKLVMNIHVIWHADDSDLPIEVTFNGTLADDKRTEDWTSGIEDITVDALNGEAEYFNLNGARVANPENGLYIVRRGTKVTKELVK